MATAVKYRRVQAIKLADALNAIEGDYTRLLSACWARGELTGTQMKEELLASQRKLTERESRAHA